VLLHRQADDVWRIDFQLGWDADPDEERKPERVIPRIRAMLGDDRPFELEWVSVYTFQCRRLDRFVHGRVIFAGDAAHQVSPFGARGANSGIQDADNLCWKLARVVREEAAPALLATYDVERVAAADENILNSTRSTDFITPKSAMSRLFRDAVLDLSVRHPFARRLVNSGRLSMPTTYRESVLDTPDTDTFVSVLVPGSPASDAPVRIDGHAGWLLDRVGGAPAVLYFMAPERAGDLERLVQLAGELRVVVVAPAGGSAFSTGGAVVVEDVDGLVARRYGAAPGTTYLLRPDQHIAARWRRWDAPAFERALARATGRKEVAAHAA
jgi:3-(3-hydroxy-phenyl)propionate hydroxylase